MKQLTYGQNGDEKPIGRTLPTATLFMLLKAEQIAAKHAHPVDGGVIENIAIDNNVDENGVALGLDFLLLLPR